MKKYLEPVELFKDKKNYKVTLQNEFESRTFYLKQILNWLKNEELIKDYEIDISNDHFNWVTVIYYYEDAGDVKSSLETLSLDTFIEENHELFELFYNKAI